MVVVLTNNIHIAFLETDIDQFVLSFFFFKNLELLIISYVSTSNNGSLTGKFYKHLKNNHNNFDEFCEIYK